MKKRRKRLWANASIEEREVKKRKEKNNNG